MDCNCIFRMYLYETCVHACMQYGQCNIMLTGRTATSWEALSFQSNGIAIPFLLSNCKYSSFLRSNSLIRLSLSLIVSSRSNSS